MIIIIVITGLCIPAMFLLLCSFYGNTAGWAITFLTLSVGCTCFGVAGYHVNYLDISPKYAGILMGISNTIATIPGFVGPQVAKAIAKGVRAYTLCKLSVLCIYFANKKNLLLPLAT